jgi:hypothetical protein
MGTPVANFPKRDVTQHLFLEVKPGKFEPLLNSAFSVLLCARPAEPTRELIAVLLSVAQSTLRVRFILIDVTQLLVNNMSWLENELPSWDDTLCLFGAVMCWTQLRPKINFRTF